MEAERSVIALRSNPPFGERSESYTAWKWWRHPNKAKMGLQRL